jgi:hypothetical protein
MRLCRYAQATLLCLGLFLACAYAQQPLAPQPGSANSLALPVISFTLDFPGSVPEHYQFQVGSDGRTTYDSVSKISSQSEDRDNFHHEFVMSLETLQKIVQLTAKANRFQKLTDHSSRQMANTGKKTLSYRDDKGVTEGTYNYSKQPAVEELTTLFENISLTMEFGRRLRYDHRYQKLALDQEIKRMEEMARSNSLTELQAVEPILQQIAADTSVINGARARAQRLIAMGSAEPAR